jgi:PAS domain S-box-containing protein
MAQPPAAEAPDPDAAEPQLVGDEARWHALVAHLPDNVTEVDLEGRILATNRVPAGRDAAGILGRPFAELVPEPARPAFAEALAECIATGRPLARRGRADRPNGTAAWWLARFVPVAVGGAVLRVIVIASDITPLERAEQALRASEERLALALDAAEYGVWDWNVATGEVAYDDRWLRILGFARGDVPADIDTWRSRVHPDDLASVDAAMAAHWRGETEAFAAEHRLRRKDGTFLWVLTRGRIVARGPEGRPLRIAGTQRDVSDRKRADAEREALIAQLQKALADVRTLSGLLPICFECKQIRDDRGTWRQLEDYLEERSGAQFSHGLCRDCASRLHAELHAARAGRPPARK